MTMNEDTANHSVKRNVNIDSAIDESSFQLPVFVAISAEGGEAQVVKTFATAREVFDHVYSILLDRLRQRHAVEAVERLVPQTAHLTSSSDTEYVLLVRGKAIFWFSGAAAKRAAGRKLLLEHARDLADAERAPFYVLNSRPKRIRAAILVLAICAIIAAVVLLKNVHVDWSFKAGLHQAVRTPYLADAVDKRLDEQGASKSSAVRADYAEADRVIDLSAVAGLASRGGQTSRASDLRPIDPENQTTISKLEESIANFVREWPGLLNDRMQFAYSYFNDVTKVPPSRPNWRSVPQPPAPPAVSERRTGVRSPDMAERTADSGRSKL